MIPYERQKKILSIIEEKELVKIDELQKIFDGVSVSTLRRDLKELENYLYALVSKDVNILDGNSDLKRLIRIFDFLKNKK